MKALLIALESLIFHIKIIVHSPPPPPPPPPLPPTKICSSQELGNTEKSMRKKNVSIKMHFISDLKDFLLKRS